MTIPWPEYRLKHLVRPIVDKATTSESDEPYVGLEAITSWTGEIDTEKSEDTGESLGNRFRRGDVLFGKLRPYLAKVTAPDFSGHCSGEALVLRPVSNICTRFLRYQLVDAGTIDAVNASTYGAKMPRASWDFIGNLRFRVPNRDTQKAIADFLDRETARIDQLIKKKQRLVEILSERERAIYDAVVLGKSGECQSFKSVSVPWIKEIPSHWAVQPLKQLLSRPITDGPHETPVFIDDGVIFISAEAIQNGEIDFSRARGFISKEANEKYSQKYSPKTGDIYVVKSGATTGKSAMVGDFTDFNIWSPLAVLRASPKIDAEFLLMVLRSTPTQDAIALSWSWGTQQNIGMGVLGRIRVPVPPKAEQDKLKNTTIQLIGPHLKTQGIIRKSIDRLNEFRSALITAAVTGQIDVTTWGKQGHTDRRLDEIEEAMRA